MSNLRQAAQQALEALTNCTSEYGHRCNRCDSEVDEGGKVVEALRAALAQERAEPAQEPVAWMNVLAGGYKCLAGKPIQGWTPLYLAPPQRPPLTDEEIRAHADKHLRYQPQSYEASGVFDLVRAIERKVRGETE